MNTFGQKQLELSTELIAYADPKMIVVANALASRLFKDTYSAEFDNVHGYYAIELNGRSVPVFLASMLTGQRAMDNFSYERLKWHIKKAFQEQQMG